MGKQARLNASLREQAERTVEVLAKALSAFLPADQAIIIENRGKKHLVSWEGGNLSIQGGEQFEQFEDGMLMQARPPEEAPAEVSPEDEGSAVIESTSPIPDIPELVVQDQPEDSEEEPRIINPFEG